MLQEGRALRVIYRAPCAQLLNYVVGDLGIWYYVHTNHFLQIRHEGIGTSSPTTHTGWLQRFVELVVSPSSEEVWPLHSSIERSSIAFHVLALPGEAYSLSRDPSETLMWKAISSCPPTRQSTTRTIVNISRDVVMHVEEKNRRQNKEDPLAEK